MYKFKQFCHEAHFTKLLSIQVCKLHESISQMIYFSDLLAYFHNLQGTPAKIIHLYECFWNVVLQNHERSLHYIKETFCDWKLKIYKCQCILINLFWVSKKSHADFRICREKAN